MKCIMKGMSTEMTYILIGILGLLLLIMFGSKYLMPLLKGG